MANSSKASVAADFATKALKNLDVTEGLYIPVAGKQIFVPMVAKENGQAVFKVESFIPKEEVPDIVTKLP